MRLTRTKCAAGRVRATAVLAACSLALGPHAHAQQVQSVQKQPDGITLSLGRDTLQVLAPDAIRVRDSADGVFPPQRVPVLITGGPQAAFRVLTDAGSVTLAAGHLRARVDRRTGAVRFLNASGQQVLGEAPGVRALTPVVLPGPAPSSPEASYLAEDAFELAPGEAIYGLGQHQDGHLDHRGTTVVEEQGNREVGIPLPVLAQDAGAAPTGTQAYRDVSQPLAARVSSLIGQMTLEEKTAQLQNSAPAIPRLGVPAYNYWSEGLHGIANEGIATVFPQAIGNAATWDVPLVHAIGDVVSTEARAKFNAKGVKGDHGLFNGLTIWSPNINIFRDPRWGRGQETYGEDPYLTARMGVAFIQGMQGNDPQYLKAVACAKHFAVHSGPEPLRHRFDVHPPERDLYETYLPQFEAAVREGHVGQVMSAYNAINGVPAPADKWLLTDLLRDQWGFQGYVVSDCDAVGDIVSGHHYADTREQAAADAVKAGTDLNCGGTYNALVAAVHSGLISEGEVNTALGRVLTERFRLGLFDPPTYAYAKITAADNDLSQNSALALRAAHESMVLLKNNGLLPLDPAKLRRVAVIGANATDTEMLHGNYNGSASHPVSILQGLKDGFGTGVEVTYARGCPLAVNATDTFGPSSIEYQQALEAAKNADVIIYVGGISARLEGEEMRVTMVGFTGGDRTRIELPHVQEDLLKALSATGRPVVFVNCSGSAMAIPWEADHLAAILQAWYPGENGGTAVADVLLGRYNPAGRLPVTFYASTADLPDFQNYSMAGRTYRYYAGKALFPFGYGLSYTSFSYGKPRFSARQLGPASTLRVTVPVRNTGARDGDEIVQVYVRHVNSAVPQPIRSLCTFQRVSIPSGQTRTATLTVSSAQFRYWDVARKAYVVEPGSYELQIGASSADIRARQIVTVTAP